MIYASPFTPSPFIVQFDRLADRTISPRWAARVLARLAARSLDRRLIDGGDPASSTLLAARACRLTSYSHREQLADGLERLVPNTTRSDLHLRVAPHRGAIERHADDLRSLASLLRSVSPLYASGIARLGRLVSDGTGPVYVGPPEMLARRLGEVRIALNG